MNKSFSKKLFTGFLFVFFTGQFLQGVDPGHSNSLPFKVVPVDYVPASFPVNFALFTSNEIQYVAFYDSAHQMTVARRNINDSVWDYHHLDSKVGWDSHNYLALFVDREGYIHLSGNMHSNQLIYYRSTIPYDMHSLQPFHIMTGIEEDMVTYPEFIEGPDGELIFHYRYGRSGSGHEVFNIWEGEDKKWVRMLGKPLTDGRGIMNAYMQGPLLGPDRYYHLIWVWRDTPDCRTNHTLSYARSKDLLNWESIRGENVELPVTIDYVQLYVDTTPVDGGLINTGIRLGFDADSNVLIGYHRYDSTGNTQLFLSRFQEGRWISSKVTEWNYRWDFKGYGTIINELLIEPPKPSYINNYIVFGYHHIKYGNGQIVIDGKTLMPLRTEALETVYPGELDSLHSPVPEMIINKVFDSGKAPGGKQYLLRWETLKPNRDLKQQENIPPPTMLELIEY